MFAVKPAAEMKVKVGNDQEKAQSERNSYSKNRGGKKLYYSKFDKHQNFIFVHGTYL